ncbi:SGNH hydrolase [Venustampulla echinocandica]|uniref:SGNH hydrolase n=1 Tax=Venustampulla echinocandica TaxID=2656787 RepID=A0A370TIZ6_9HELO|nr:SGNH hydrolase [Venustampulla echinocandica]RDL35318.1 SGNH hydrolase [Venustampulla echinocandica]
MLLSKLLFWLSISGFAAAARANIGNHLPAKRATIKVHDRPSFPHNATLHRRANINKYGGCDKLYKNGKSKGKDIVKQGYHDMLRMTQHINPFLVYLSPEGDAVQLAPGPIEKRFFGDFSDQSYKRSLIYGIMQNAANWWPWYPWDWFFGSRIEVYCEVDQPTKSDTSCNSQLPGQPGTVGAYATNLNGRAKIVFCRSFFAQPSLDEVKAELDKFPGRQKDLGWMKTRAHIFFHEMTHLSIVENRYPHIVLDQKENPVGSSGKAVYGARKSEELAQRFPDYAYLNADNYAWYATAMWFKKFYGDPDPSSVSSTGADQPPEDDWVDFFEDDGSKPIPTEFDDPDYDEISEAEAIAFQAGDYTPYGWLKNKNLRILPLGDSITYGFQSSDGNGYRQDLLSILTGAKNTVQMIGSVRAGTMANNFNEGHNGATISQLATYTSAYGQRPNIILLHAGTNDLNLPSEPASAPQRLDSLVGQLVSACPDATIIVARIIPSTNGGLAALLPQFNNAITGLMAQRVRQGQQVMVVDMPSGVTTGDLADGLHPNDEGYNKMAIKWASALTAADSIGWIKDPVQGSGNPLATCNHDPVWLPQGQIANGAGLGSNLWLTVSCASNPITGLCTCTSGKDIPLTPALLSSTATCEIEMLKFPATTAVHFADLNGDGRSEYLYVDNEGGVTAFLNLGAPNQGADAAKISWLPQGEIAAGVGATRASVQFADINGDGRADYLWVHDDGSVDCWLNLGGPDNGPNAAKVSWLPQGKIASGIGKDGAGVRFADINGDGRAEYLYVYTDGSVEAYLNLGGPDNGPNAAKVSWLPQGVIATGVGKARENVVFADVNGDGRADYLTVSRTDGSVQLWLNGGGPDTGSNAAKVVWLPHGTIATGVGTNGKGIQFSDLNGDGRAEFVDVAYDTSAVTAWLNGSRVYKDDAHGLKIHLYDVPIPIPAPDQVLIKVTVSGSNPKDWKLLSVYPDHNGFNSGDDIASIVQSVGSEANSEFKPGDRVAAFHTMMSPSGSYPAATIPLYAMTAALGLFSNLDLQEPWVSTNQTRTRVREGGIIVYGAASAVGAFAIKLLVHADIHPIICVAGKGISFVETLIDTAKGDTIIDYREGSDAVIRNIAAAVPGGQTCAYAYDAVSDQQSTANIAKVLDPHGHINLLWPLGEYPSLPPSIQQARFNVAVMHENKKDREFAYPWFRLFGYGLEQGWLTSHSYEVCEGGFQGVGIGLRKLMNGEASAVKYVFRVADTAALGESP